MNILILGASGFIGSNLITHILQHRDWHIHAMDIASEKLTPHLSNPRLHFKQADIRTQTPWVEDRIRECDIVLPLAAIASPAAYVNTPLDVFELDFECNLDIVRLCAKHGKRLIFPSTSEVYGMQGDAPCNEHTSNLITGPTHKERWIYAASKQLMDRVIYAYGIHHNLPYTLFRPFNWFGPGQDDVWRDAPTNRVIPTFLHHVLHRQNLQLVDGGAQKRCFLYIDDAIDALIRIIENKNNAASGQIFNIGHPGNEASISELAHLIISQAATHPAYNALPTEIHFTTPTGEDYYGTGYQDIDTRMPDIAHAQQKLGWNPTTPLAEGLQKTIAHYLTQAPKK